MKGGRRRGGGRRRRGGGEHPAEHVEYGGTDAGRREEQSRAGVFEGSCEGAPGKGAANWRDGGAGGSG